MKSRLLSGREALVWTGCFLLTSALIVATRFTSADPDSSLYASIAARLSQEPVSRWIAPQWWGLWARLGPTGYYRDHPVGGFLVPAALARLGVPGVQAAYIVGIGAGLAAVLLIATLVMRLTSRADARSVLILLPIMPVAFVFRVRANQEYAMLVCTLVAMIGIDRLRRSWSGAILVAIGLVAALLVKGLFVVLVIAAVGLWALIHPPADDGRVGRSAAVLAGAAVLLGVCALLYDWAYRHVTGEGFWQNYWGQQLAPVAIATPTNGLAAMASRAGFYLARLLWHPAPWSVAALALLWPIRTIGARWRRASGVSRRSVLFVVAFAVVIVAMLIPSDRVAERYVFSPTYAVAALGIVAARWQWRSFGAWLDRLDAQVPALPALTWLALTAVRVMLGPLGR